LVHLRDRDKYAYCLDVSRCSIDPGATRGLGEEIAVFSTRIDAIPSAIGRALWLRDGGCRVGIAEALDWMLLAERDQRAA
jgi:hypothetical protein